MSLPTSPPPVHSGSQKTTESATAANNPEITATQRSAPVVIPGVASRSVIPHDVGEKSHIAGPQDRAAHSALKLGASPGPAARQDVAVAGDHDFEGPQILVVDIDRARAPFFRAESALERPLGLGRLTLVR